MQVQIEECTNFTCALHNALLRVINSSVLIKGEQHNYAQLLQLCLTPQDYREYRVTPLKPPVLGTPSMGAKKRPPAKPTETQSSSPLLTFLSSELCQRVAKGLLGYALALANEGEWNLVPVTCKVLYFTP